MSSKRFRPKQTHRAKEIYNYEQKNPHLPEGLIDVSKEDEQYWVHEIDKVVTVFPQHVISRIITKLLVTTISFDTVLTPSCVHGYNHKEFNINDFVVVEEKKITVLKYNYEWIYIPIIHNINNSKLQICLYVNGPYTCQLRFVENSTHYQTFIGETEIVNTCLSGFELIGKCIITIMPDTDELTCLYFDRTDQSSSKVRRSYSKGALRKCNTALIGVGWQNQSIAILPCPSERNLQYENEQSKVSLCGCDLCSQSRGMLSNIDCECCRLK